MLTPLACRALNLTDGSNLLMQAGYSRYTLLVEARLVFGQAELDGQVEIVEFRMCGRMSSVRVQWCV